MTVEEFNLTKILFDSLRPYRLRSLNGDDKVVDKWDERLLELSSNLAAQVLKELKDVQKL